MELEGQEAACLLKAFLSLAQGLDFIQARVGGQHSVKELRGKNRETRCVFYKYCPGSGSCCVQCGQGRASMEAERKWRRRPEAWGPSARAALAVMERWEPMKRPSDGDCRAEEEGCVGIGESWDLGWGRWGHWECPSLTETNLGKQSVRKVVSSVLVLLHLRSRKTWRYLAAPWMSALSLEEVPKVPVGETVGRVIKVS